MSALLDTIVAPATPHGTSALALLRVSGSRVPGLVLALFEGSPLLPRVATRCVYHASDGSVLDEVVATHFVEPHSYTGEHLLEISTHGNPLVVQRVMADLLQRGCAAAGPGEFTRRAYLNQRLDLAQAEAVMDVIHAKSERALTAAQQQLRGSLGRHLAALTDQLLTAVARVEAYIDFPEEDLPAEDTALLQNELQHVLRGTQRLLATHRYGDLLRGGLKTVLIGAPNVGKSSLLNALLGRERALVSPEPGTTRDYLEELVTVGPHALRLIDTAGVHDAPGTVEGLGIAQTFARAEEADLFLLILDATHPASPPPPAAIRDLLTPDNTLVVLNKADLQPAPAPPSWAGQLPCLTVSALTDTGLPTLRERIVALADRQQTIPGEEVIAINARHADALTRTNQSLEQALAHLSARGPTELLASDLREALHALGEIAGRIDHEQVLDKLFAGFCIGK